MKITLPAASISFTICKGIFGTCLLSLGMMASVYAQVPQPAQTTPPAPTVSPNATPAAYPADMKVNYVRTWEPAKPLTDPAAVVSGSATDVRQTTQYVDGLGRPLQTVSRGITVSGKDLVAPVIYDAFGREQFKYLPYAVTSGGGQFRQNPFGEQAAFAPVQYPGESVFYSETKYEASPLNRVDSMMAPGNSWAGRRNAVTSQYLVNTAGDGVKIWDIGALAEDYPVARNYDYGAGQLYKNVSKDEAGHEVVEFKDKEGQVILKKVQLTAAAGSEGHSGWLCTYYVYDDLGNLRYVLQPRMVEVLSTNGWSLADADHRKELCFRYVYDHRRRMILKQVPGADPVEMVYDVRDRLVFSQDALQRQAGKWLATFYDDLNRPVMTALYTTSQDGAALRSAMGSGSGTTTITQVVRPPMDLTVNTHDRQIYRAGKTITFENGFDSGTGEMETILDSTATVTTETIYANNPLSTLDPSKLYPLTYTYYDDYSFGSAKTARTDLLSGIPHSGSAYTDALPVSSQTKGLVTGTKVRLLEGNGANDRWLTATTYYDAKGRVLQVLSDNALDGEDITSNLYDFNGRLLSSLALYKNPRSAVSPELRQLTMHEYDHGGRLLKVRKKLGSNGTVVDIATNEYDELGQLQKKTFKKSNGVELESLAYDYNIRGWLRGINKKYLSGEEAHYFGQELSYDYGFSANQLNGNIAGAKWKAYNDPTNRAYGYSYDKANRLLKADFREAASGGNWGINSNVIFDVKMGDGSTPTTAYDANGNILKMEQWGKTGLGSSSKIDDLVYNYVNQSSKPGNKLVAVKDDGNNGTPGLGDFREQTYNQAVDYTYDGNGNMISDANKGITNIVYNYLNLPSLITISGKGEIRYIYDAAGIKHRKIVNDLTGPQPKESATDYNANLVYERDSLRLVMHEEGRIRLDYPIVGEPAMYVYDYFVKDHLGNVRAVLTEQTQQQLYLASMEAERSATETALFSNIESSRSAKPAGYPQDATAGSENKQVAKLNGSNPDKRVGPSLVLKVMAGDTISIGAKAFYKSIGTKQHKQQLPAGDMAAALLRAFGGGEPGGGHKEATSAATSRSPFNDQFINDGYRRMKEKDPQDGPQAGRPKAYLNFALFDEEFNLVEENSGVKQVKAEPDQLQTLAQDRMVVKKGGFLYVYTSNETPQDVFFDNLMVAVEPGALLEETQYYPFGLTMVGISNRAIYNSGNKQQKFQGQPFDDELELNWYGFKYRNHDPQIGRFVEIDPLSEKYVHNSPYAFSENKVTAHVELEGLESVSIQGLTNQIWNSLGISKSYNGKEFAQDLGEAAKRPEPYIGALDMMAQFAVVTLASVMTEGVGSGSLFTASVRNVRNTVASAALESGEASLAASVRAPVAVTEESIASALEGSTMRTTQNSVSLPIVERYVRKLEAGSPAPEIKVADGVIVDGNHRFVAGRLVGTEPAVAPGTISPSQVPFARPVKELKIDLFDWGKK